MIRWVFLTPLYFILGVFIFHLLPYFPVLLSIALVVITGLLIKGKDLWKILFLLAGILYSFIRAEDLNLEDIKGDATVGREIYAKAIFLSVEKAPSQKLRYKVLLKSCNVRPCPSYLNIYTEAVIEPGSEAEVLLHLSRKRHGLVPGLIESSYNARSIRIDGIKRAEGLRWIIEKQRLILYDLFGKIFQERSRGLARALVTGHREIEPEVREAFRKTGLSHLLSISGTHFGLLFTIIFFFFKRILLLLPYNTFHKLTTYVSVNLLSVLFTIPFLLWYLLLSGMQIPALRSFLMILCFLLGLFIGRRYYWFMGLSLAALIIVIINPVSLFDLSFILSFSAVLFIGLFLERFHKERPSGDRSILKKIIELPKQTFLISLAATMGTLPVIAYCFHYISLVGLLSNLIVTPIVGFVIVPMLLFISLFYLFSGLYFLGNLPERLMELTLKIIEFFASFRYAEIPVLPFAPFLIILLYGALFLFIFSKGRWRYPGIILFLLLVLILCFRTDRSLHITFVDVDQGDGAVVELPDGRVIVIDTGRDGLEVSSYLRYRAKRIIDALVLTHPHPDHTGGLERLMRDFIVREIWDNGFFDYSEKNPFLKRRVLSRGDILKTNEYAFLILHPYKGFYSSYGSSYTAENNLSLVMKFISKDLSVLFTGDIEWEAQDDLIHLGSVLRADVLKVPHHGSRSSANEIFFNMVSPEIAIISAGRGNPHGHPHREVLSLLQNTPCYITSRDGSIKITPSEGRIYVKIYKDYLITPVRRPVDELKNMANLFRVF